MMTYFSAFASKHGVAFAKLYYELLQTEHFAQLSYTEISRYFQTEFKENPNYEHAATLIGDFLKKERLVSYNSDIANMPSDALADVVNYVHEISNQEDANEIIEMLLHDREAYAKKIENLCKDLIARFGYLQTPTVATAILSLMTGWCPILSNNFLPYNINSSKYIALELARAIDTLDPLIVLCSKLFGMDQNIWFVSIWTFTLFVIKIYNNYYKY